MDYEEGPETGVIASLLHQGHTLRLPKHGIFALRRKGKFLVSIKKKEHWFEDKDKAAALYKQETHKAYFRAHLEHCSAVVATWPEWKRSALGHFSGNNNA